MPIKVDTLPIKIKDINGVKRWRDDRGECAQLTSDELPIHIAVLEIKEGTIRGDHYHKIAEEIFYIIYGTIILTVWDIRTRTYETYVLHDGDKVCIPPLYVHRFFSLKDTLIVEYSLTPYNKNDSYKED